MWPFKKKKKRDWVKVKESWGPKVTCPHCGKAFYFDLYSLEPMPPCPGD